MNIEEKLKGLILERYGSMVEFAKEIDISNTTLASLCNNIKKTLSEPRIRPNFAFYLYSLTNTI